MVAPIMPPVGKSSRAKYQMLGAVRPKWGSLANKLPPAADRDGAAAQALDAPANGADLNGDKGSSK